MKKGDPKLRALLLASMCLGIFGWAESSRAATINAATCEQADVQAAITSASNGDTVIVPAGSCAWGALVTIPETKTIKLIGAGSSNTIISRDGPMILSSSPGSRVSGFRFNLISSGLPPMVEMRNVGWRVDHNYFDNQTGSSREGVIASGSNMDMQPEGVIDNNIFNDCRVGSYGMGTFAKQNIAWAEDNNFGSEHSVYVEDNTITKIGYGNVMDSNYAGRYVFRYNNVINSSVMTHSVQGSSHRASKSWEVYGNSFTFTATDYSNALGFMRGGTGFFFNNFVTGPYSTSYIIKFDNVRSFQTGCCGAIPPTTNSGMCDGTSAWDGNVSGQKGWPCRDQIGRGKDSALFDTTTFAESTFEPAYLWSNKRSTGADAVASIANGCESWVQADRDYYDYNGSFNGTSGTGCGTLASRSATCTAGVGYWATDRSCVDLTGMVGANPSTPISGTLYKCTAPNTWTAYYTPYTYPHPLRNEDLPPDTTPPAAPSGLIVL